MKNILLLGPVKLAFVPIRDPHEPAVLNRNDNGILSGISAFQYLNNLPGLKRDFIIHVITLFRRLRQNFHAIRRDCYRMLEVST